MGPGARDLQQRVPVPLCPVLPARAPRAALPLGQVPSARAPGAPQGAARPDPSPGLAPRRLGLRVCNCKQKRCRNYFPLFSK